MLLSLVVIAKYRLSAMASTLLIANGSGLLVLKTLNLASSSRLMRVHLGLFQIHYYPILEEIKKY